MRNAQNQLVLLPADAGAVNRLFAVK